MHTYMPMLVLRMREGKAAIQLNGVVAGETSESAHLALPLSDNGEYYIGIFPLLSYEQRYYPVMRKLSFRDGQLQPVESDDVEIYEWPNRVYEAVLTPGILERMPEADFPFTVDQVQLNEQTIATLYYDNGMKFAVEEGPRVRYGLSLGQERTGRIRMLQNGLIAISCGDPNLDEAEIPEEFSRTLFILDGEWKEIIRLKGDAVGMRGEEEIVRYMRLSTTLGHDKKQIYRLQENAFVSDSAAEIGFFTHSPLPPKEGAELIRAFCDAVLYELWNEALAYLTTSLKEGLDQENIRACLGEFTGVRTPLTRANCAIGLLYPSENGIVPVRVFSFTFENGRIDNIEED